MSFAERRGSPRASLDLPVEVHTEAGSFPARLRSLSRMGALIQIEKPLAIGSPLQLRIGPPVAEMSLRGQVIRATPSDVGRGHELALMFAPLPPGALASIDSLLDQGDGP